MFFLQKEVVRQASFFPPLTSPPPTTRPDPRIHFRKHPIPAKMGAKDAKDAKDAIP
jgi:hypothetical protein